MAKIQHSAFRNAKYHCQKMQCLNPATLFPTPDDGQEHNCVAVLQQSSNKIDTWVGPCVKRGDVGRHNSTLVHQRFFSPCAGGKKPFPTRLHHASPNPDLTLMMTFCK